VPFPGNILRCGDDDDDNSEVEKIIYVDYHCLLVNPFATLSHLSLSLSLSISSLSLSSLSFLRTKTHAIYIQLLFKMLLSYFEQTKRHTLIIQLLSLCQQNNKFMACKELIQTNNFHILLFIITSSTTNGCFIKDCHVKINLRTVSILVQFKYGTMCVKDCGLHDQRIYMIILFAC